MTIPNRFPIRTGLISVLAFASFASVSGAQVTGNDFRLLETVTLSPAPGAPSPFDTLVEVDPQTAAQTLSGPAGAAIGIYQMDSNPTTGILIGTDFSRPGVIYQIDPATGVASMATTLAARVAAIAFAPDGTLYGTENSNHVTGNVLGTIDLEKQTFSPVMTLSAGSVVASMDFSPSGLLYAAYVDVASSKQSLVVLDVATRSIVSTASLPTALVGDMDYAPDGFVYHSNFSYALFRIDPANPVQTLVGFGQVGGAGALASVVIGVQTLTVQIDVKPGSRTNPINPCAGGVVPVAILSTPSFDARIVDPATVMVGEAPARIRGKRGAAGSLEDVDRDGDLDLVVHVQTTQLGLHDGDVGLTLTGRTFEGAQIKGTDSITVVPARHRTGGASLISCR